jgi:hypothetical protein
MVELGLLFTLVSGLVLILGLLFLLRRLWHVLLVRRLIMIYRRCLSWMNLPRSYTG